MVAVLPAIGSAPAYHWPVAGASGVSEKVAGVAVRVCPTVGVPVTVGLVRSRKAVTMAATWALPTATAETGCPVSDAGTVVHGGVRSPGVHGAVRGHRGGRCR